MDFWDRSRCGEGVLYRNSKAILGIGGRVAHSRRQYVGCEEWWCLVPAMLKVENYSWMGPDVMLGAIEVERGRRPCLSKLSWREGCPCGGDPEGFF